MRIGPFGLPEILIIFLVIALIFGTRRLPEIGDSLGRGLRAFKSSLTDAEKGNDANEDDAIFSAKNGRDDRR